MIAELQQKREDRIRSDQGPFTTIAIVGMGLIGASIAGAAKQAWPAICIAGIDTSDYTREKALADGLCDVVFEPADPAFRDFLVNECELVVLATPVDVDEEYFELIESSGYSGIVTDTASTKERIVKMAESILSHPENYVPGHPMAGSEVNGIGGARADMFQGVYWIICPNEQTPADHFMKLHEFACGLGARVISLPREDHDRAVAVVSHVPHIVASSLVMLADNASDEGQMVMRLAAGGFKDTTRIAAGSPELWCGIVFDNASKVKAGIEDMRSILGSFASALENGDRRVLTDLLARAAKVRRDLPQAWVPSTERLLEVRLPMENRTGVIAEATTIASSAGCNIQSIEIDHVSEDRAYLSMILTDEGDIGKLTSSLIDAGFPVSLNPIQPKEHIHV